MKKKKIKKIKIHYEKTKQNKKTPVMFILEKWLI